MYFITDKIRSEVVESINNSSYIPYIGAHMISLPHSEVAFELLLIDYYNVTLVKKIGSNIDSEDNLFLELINTKKVDELKKLTAYSPFIKKIVTSLLTFNSLSTLDKHNIIDIANKLKEDNDLTSRTLFKLNVLACTPSCEVDDLLNYYKDYIKVNGPDLNNHNRGSDIIINYLNDIKENNINEYEKNILAAIPTYYKCEKFSNFRQNINLRSFRFLKRIELLNIKSLLNRIKKDDDFMMQIMKQYLYYETLSNEIKKEVEVFSEKTLSKRIKQKLNRIKKEENKK